MNALSKVSNTELHSAFEQFNQISEQFTHAYYDLESRFKQLRLELSDTKAKRLIELAEKEKLANRIHLLLMTLPMGVVVVDNEGLIQDFNQAACTLLGIELKEMSWSLVLQSLAPNKTYQDDVVTLKINNRHLQLTNKSILGSSDALVLINDVTETILHVDSVNRHERLAFLGNAIASIAHDIRTPLATTFFNLSNLDKKLTASGYEDGSNSIDKVRYGLKVMENIINNMLIYVKGGIDSFDIYSCKDSCNLITKDILEVFPDLAIKLCQSENLINRNIKANINSLMTVFRNILSNAINVTGDDLKVDVNFYISDGRHLKIEIKDNGPGINEELIDRIFDPFFTTRSNGTGLGLSIAKSIIDAHDGRIYAQRISTGSMFTVEIPLTISEKNKNTQG